MLRLEGIDAGYGGTQVLRGIGLEAKQGVTTVLIGPNGAGKSTTLKVVNGLLRPTRGRVSFEGKDITMLPAHERAARGIASCPEGRRLFPLLTADFGYVVQDGRIVNEGPPDKLLDMEELRKAYFGIP